MSRTLAMLFVLSACTGSDPTDSDTDPDTDPLVEECDADGDGVEAVSCGGLDCDDDDATVRPGEPERLGDDIDQDCNGKPNLGTILDAPFDGELFGHWSFSPDGQLFGGLTKRPGDEVDSVQMPVGTGAVPVVFETEVLAFTVTAPPVRVWVGTTPFDVFGFTDRLVGGIAMHEGSAVDVIAERPGDGPTWVSSAVVGDEIQSVGCGSGLLEWASSVFQETTQYVSLEQEGNRCAPLGTGAGYPLLSGDEQPGPLNRWRVRDGEITDRTTIVPNKSLANIATSARSGQALYAFTDVEQIYLFDVQARGVILDGEGRISSIAVSGDGKDGYALAWVTTAGRLKIAWGTLAGEEPTVISTLVPNADQPIAVSLTDQALTVAWVGDDGWHIEQALR
ncbi:MAG: MopE-related protein [Myxococcota bacterium]